MIDVRTLECIIKVIDPTSHSSPLPHRQRMRVSITVARLMPR